jgi:uncharacterized protein
MSTATVDDPRWAAVVARDAAADGNFFYSVRTTGVYCRPSCKARLPRPENVAFHQSAQAAEAAGFRPCKRCRPETGPNLTKELDTEGFAILESLLSMEQCEAVAASYSDDSLFRSRVVMARYGFGRGEYKYFQYPLPPLVQKLRTELYPRLMPMANRWYEAMGMAPRFPATHAEFLERCHAAGQARPTPLLLQYGVDDFNCLHQDLYGEHVFPLQVAVLLSDGFTGGEFVMTEQRPRMQSRAMVVPLRRGDGVVFAVHTRPVQGTRGTYRVNMRHGVSRIRSGQRHTLGIIFHDAAV